MIPDDVFVLDAVAHAYNFADDNVIGGVYANSIIEGVYGFHTAYSPPGRPDLLLKREVFLNRIADPDVTAGFLFRESHTDACIYHELPLYGYFKDGGSPLSVADRDAGEVARPGLHLRGDLAAPARMRSSVWTTSSRKSASRA